MTIAVDFDGVIHRYSKGWLDGTIYDPPVEGAFSSIKYLMIIEPVFIFTSRNPDEVAQWIESNSDLEALADDEGKHPITFWNDQSKLFVTNRKLPAKVYVDDKGLRFNLIDKWPGVMEEIWEFL